MLFVPVTLTRTVSSDETLLGTAALGDRTSQDELFQRYKDVAFRVAYRLLSHEEDALDAVQDGFTHAFLKLDTFRSQSSFKTWLLRVVANAALDLGRKRRRRESRLLSFFQRDKPSEVIDPKEELDSFDREDLRIRLHEAIQSLPEVQRITFTLHVEGELSYKEVADTLGISIGTVMSRLYYARRKLQTQLSDVVIP